MLYSTIVQRDETGFNQIYDAAREFEEENVLEALITCKFDMKKVEQTLNLVRIYQNRLNIESMDLVEFSDNFIEHRIYVKKAAEIFLSWQNVLMFDKKDIILQRQTEI